MNFICSILFFVTLNAFAESSCELRPGSSIGIKVIEFTSGNVVLSKMPLRESSPDALLEEMVNLQDMGLCEEKIPRQKCLLKFEKTKKETNVISLYRGGHRWNSWTLKSKEQAQNFVKHLKRAGFCS